MRIVSLVPSATEIVFALGLGDELVGRTDGCDHPEEVGDVPVVARRVAEGPRALSATAEPGAGGLALDVPALLEADPDLVLTQRLRPAEAVRAADLAHAVGRLGGEVDVISLDATSVEGIFNSISTVGAFAEAEDEAVGLLEILRERLGAIENRLLERRLIGIAPRRVVVLDAIVPPFAAGYWVPEMVRRAGGWELLGQEAEPPLRTSWERIRDVDPEQLIVAPHGMHVADAAAAFERATLPAWLGELRAVRDGETYAVDAAGLISRPGPRIVEGIGLLAGLFDPEGFDDVASRASWIPLGTLRGLRPR